ncbi:MAG TPA: hypothetical protein VFL03_11380 [Candidatus Limnocylindrales bacterium]|jgi:hypothetical protein|nr:hypothetical protein [Candidatus Limnocylindrales bacterium]
MTTEQPRQPAPDQPWTDDPTLQSDGLDPGEENEVPQARRHHGGVDDPAHPDYFTTGHRRLPQAQDLRGQPERDLVVDDHASQTAGAGAATQATIGQPAVPGSADSDDHDDPRHDRPDAQPA